VSHLQTALNDYWSDRAVPYDDYQNRAERRDLDRAAWTEIWSRALPAAPQRVLDLGTGSGYLARLLADLGHEVTGTDLADGMLERARHHAARMANPPRFAVGDAVEPDFPDASVDAVVNRYLMWTLREPDRALRNWARVLRPGGILAVVDSTWFPQGLTANATDQFRRAYAQAGPQLPLAEATDIEATATLIRAAGFTDVQVQPLTTLLDLDRQYGVAPGHEVQLQHLITATRAS